MSSEICERDGCGWTKEPNPQEGKRGTYCSVLCRSVTEQSDFNNIQASAKRVAEEKEKGRIASEKHWLALGEYMDKSASDIQEGEDVREYNVGNSDYSAHNIQPWDIWLEYELNPWDADIVKRVLRKKEGDTRKLDYEKIIHVCRERIRQLDK